MGKRHRFPKTPLYLDGRLGKGMQILQQDNLWQNGRLRFESPPKGASLAALDLENLYKMHSPRGHVPVSI